MIRRLWRRLISMRTALILLFLLAIAAVPGSLLPQRPLNPTKVDAYLRTHGAWGRLLGHLGAYDVFGTPWFAAIYLLLFVSLIGCLVPRIRVHARNVAARPPAAPRHLDRLPESGSYETVASDPEAAARVALGRRWRVERREEKHGVITLSAEKGYLRETGNLIFHVALLCALVLIAIGRLFNYQGTLIVTEGHGFCNTVQQYDSWRPGRFAADGRITPGDFCIDQLKQFTATYLASGEPSTFRADVTYHEGRDGASKQDTIQVNHPLRIQGDRVYLIGHGFTPQITVRMPNGRIAQDTNSAFVPTNASTLYSEGAFKEYGKLDANQDVGIEGFFAPNPTNLGGGVVGAQAPPAVTNPILGIVVYDGTINPNETAQSVYSLSDKSKLTQIGSANLAVGQTFTAKNGVTVTFNGWKNWASIQVSHDPTQGYLLIAAVAMVLGLFGSLSIRRRRIWLRFTPATAGSDGSPTVVTVGGLARSDAGHFPNEFEHLMVRLRNGAAEPRRTPQPAGKE